MYILQSIKLRHRTGCVCSLSQNLSYVCIYSQTYIKRQHLRQRKRWLYDRRPLKIYNLTCIKRSPLRQRKIAFIRTGDLLKYTVKPVFRGHL